MMRVRDHEDLRRPHLPVDKSGGKVCGASCGRLRPALIIFFFLILAASRPALGAPSFSLLQAPGGLGGTLVGSNYLNTFGNMNALGLGTPQTGLTVVALSNGAIYFTPYQVRFQGLGGGKTASLTAYVSTNFAHPAAQIFQNCPSTGACTTSGGYSTMSTVQAAPSTVVASMGNTTVTAGLGIFLPDNNGASAFSGVDNTGVITFTMRDLSNNNVLATATFSFNAAPNNTVQTAVRLTLATATGGLPVTPAADFSMNFGNVNGLGFGPGAGLTTLAAAGGVIYRTPYLLQPTFTDFTSTTATIKTFVSTNFAHPTILVLRDATSSPGPYTNIGTTAGTATQITNTAANRSSITRFLGLFVANTNGATAFTGSDSATLTFTLTVP
jgi:hypothetical protein